MKPPFISVIMDGTSAIDAVRAELTTQSGVADLATNIAIFNEMLDAELLEGSVGWTPAELAVEASSALQPALAYAIGPGLSGSAALHMIHAVDAVIGQRVDFSG